jgi:hypothetical protein
MGLNEDVSGSYESPSPSSSPLSSALVSCFVVGIVDKTEDKLPVPKTDVKLFVPNTNGMLFDGFSFVVLVENDEDGGGGLAVISATLNFDGFEKKDLLGVVVVGGNAFVIVVCGGGTGADVEN